MADSRSIYPPTPNDLWLRAYLETLVYHEETFEALKELRTWVWHLTQAMEAMNSDMQVLLSRTRGRGLYGGDAREQAESMARRREGIKLPKKQKGKRIEVDL